MSNSDVLAVHMKAICRLLPVAGGWLIASSRWLMAGSDYGEVIAGIEQSPVVRGEYDVQW
jgi:hypothetical protein